MDAFGFDTPFGLGPPPLPEPALDPRFRKVSEQPNLGYYLIEQKSTGHRKWIAAYSINANREDLAEVFYDASFTFVPGEK